MLIMDRLIMDRLIIDVLIMDRLIIDVLIMDRLIKETRCFFILVEARAGFLLSRTGAVIGGRVGMGSFFSFS